MPLKKRSVSKPKDYRLTKQRLEILELVRKDHSHPTARKVYTQIRKKLPSISIGTVYRNLAFLRDHGLLKEFMMDKVAHFEARVDSHVHFVCEQCHGIEDIKDPEEAKLLRKMKGLAERNKFHVRSEHFEIRGICRSCARKKPPQDLAPELFCIACGTLVDDLQKEDAVCGDCKFNVECLYQPDKKKYI